LLTSLERCSAKTTETALEQFVRVGETILESPLQEIKDNLAAIGRAQLVGGFNPQKTEAANIKNAQEVAKVIENADEFIAAPIKFNRINIFGQPAPKPTWGRLDGSKLDNVIYVLQDKMIDTKRVLERIQAGWQSTRGSVERLSSRGAVSRSNSEVLRRLLK
jgi:hypothetical protein